MNWGVLALVLIVICCHIENTNSREIITRKFSDMCEIKFYGVQNFIVEHDKFDKTTAKRRRKTDRSLETLGEIHNHIIMCSFSDRNPRFLLESLFHKFAKRRRKTKILSIGIVASKESSITLVARIIVYGNRLHLPTQIPVYRPFLAIFSPTT